MAEPNLVQRSLRSLADQFRALRTGQGKSRAARLGRSMRRAGTRAKGSFGQLKTLLGLTAGVDAYDDDLDDQRRRKQARRLLGHDDDGLRVGRQVGDERNLGATVAPEYRAQVAAGLAAANSHTTGSTLADAPTSTDYE